MIKKLTSVLLACILALGITVPVLATFDVNDYALIDGIKYLPGQEVTSQRGRNHRVYYEGSGTYHAEFVGSPEFTNSNGEWVDYVFADMGSYYQIQHPWSSARFYDYYTEVWNEEFTEVRVYNDQWSIEYLNKQGNWADSSFWNITRSYEIVSDGIKLKRTGDTAIGQRVDTYYYRNGSPCKIEIKITPTEAQTVRYVWKQSGIVASGELGEVDEETGKTKGMRWTDASGNNVWIARWTEELNIVDMVNVLAESHAQGRKATITFESISVGTGEAAILDPDTFYPDAHPESSSVDGPTGEDSKVWDTVHDAISGWSYDTWTYGGIKGEYESATEYYHISRAVFLFNTSALPDDADITAATLSLYGYGTTGANGQGVNIYSSTPASNTALGATDYDNFGITAFSTTILVNDWVDEGYNGFLLNANGRAAISKTGISKFGAREPNYDVADNIPNTHTYAGVYFSEKGAGYKPKLVVTYTALDLPTVTTQAVSAIAATTATGNGNITDVGVGNCDKRGIVYGTTSKGDPGNVAPPGGYDNYEEETNSFGTGAFTRALTGLSPNETYYVRAYARNADGYSYGGQVIFNTLVAAPSISTDAATYVAQTTAQLNSTVTDDGGEPCDVRFGYDDITQAVFADYEFITDWVLDEYEEGEHPLVNIEGLTPNDEYFFRAQIKNSEGTLVTGDPELTLDTEAGFAAPSNLKAYPVSEKVLLTWTKGAGATRTMIRYSEVTYPTNETEGTLSYLGTLASHTITGLTAGHTYYIMAISSDDGNYAGTDTVMATTTAGAAIEDEPSAPEMPTTWFQSPDYTNLSNLPLYDQMNALFVAYEIPEASGWFFSAILGCILSGVIVYAISRQPTPALIALAVTLAIASLIRLLPLYMMAFTVVFIIGAFQLRGGRAIG